MRRVVRVAFAILGVIILVLATALALAAQPLPFAAAADPGTTDVGAYAAKVDALRAASEVARRSGRSPAVQVSFSSADLTNALAVGATGAFAEPVVQVAEGRVLATALLSLGPLRAHAGVIAVPAIVDGGARLSAAEVNIGALPLPGFARDRLRQQLDVLVDGMLGGLAIQSFVARPGALVADGAAHAWDAPAAANPLAAATVLVSVGPTLEPKAVILDASEVASGATLQSDRAQTLTDAAAPLSTIGRTALDLLDRGALGGWYRRYAVRSAGQTAIITVTVFADETGSRAYLDDLARATLADSSFHEQVVTRLGDETRAFLQERAFVETDGPGELPSATQQNAGRTVATVTRKGRAVAMSWLFEPVTRPALADAADLQRKQVARLP